MFESRVYRSVREVFFFLSHFFPSVHAFIEAPVSFGKKDAIRF